MFAPLIITIRSLMGTMKFNRLRGKAIGLHAQTITNFCKRFGISSKQRQGFIRLAQK